MTSGLEPQPMVALAAMVWRPLLPSPSAAASQQANSVFTDAAALLCQAAGRTRRAAAEGGAAPIRALRPWMMAERDAVLAEWRRLAEAPPVILSLDGAGRCR